VYKHTDKSGVDIVVDNVGQATFQKSLGALKRGGRLVTVGNTTGPKAEIDIRFIFFKQLRIIGSTLGTPMEFDRVMHLVWAGKLNPVIDCQMPLSEGREAHQLMERGEQFGKIVFEI
jgi:NADPH:quinone reductase-like Zn-dependent oxidoreductase